MSILFKLTAENGPAPGQTYAVEGRATIGRLKANEIPIQDASVSRHHARLLVQGARLMVRDLGSANGTFLNDAKVESATVTAGDRLRIGSINFRVDVEGVETVDSPTTAPPPAAPAPSAPEAPASATPAGMRPTQAFGQSGPDEGFDVKQKSTILQYSQYATGPKESSLLGTDLDQRSGLFKLGIFVVLVGLALTIIFFSGKVTGWLIPSPTPAAVENETGDEEE